MKFEKLKPGMVVYDVHSYAMGNTTIRSIGVWEIRIISVDETSRSCMASWNGNQRRQYFEHNIKQWKEKKPYLVAGHFGSYRRPTRAELAEHRAKQRGSA